MTAMMEPGRQKWSKILFTQADKLIPAVTGIQFIRRNMTDIQSEAYSVTESLWNWVKGQPNFPKRNTVYGTPEPMPERLWGTLKQSTPTQDRVLAELYLGGVEIQPMERTIQRQGITHHMTAEEYDRVNELIAKSNLKERLEKTVDALDKRGVVENKKRAEILKKVIFDARRIARAQLLNENPEVVDRIREILEERGKAIFDSEADPDPQVRQWKKLLLRNGDESLGINQS